MIVSRRNIPTGEVTMQELLADASRIPGSLGAYLKKFSRARRFGFRTLHSSRSTITGQSSYSAGKCFRKVCKEHGVGEFIAAPPLTLSRLLF